MRKEIRKLFMVTILLVSLAVTGCGSNKETAKENNVDDTETSTEIAKEVVTKEESATVEEDEDGTIKIKTETGEEIEISSDSTEVKEEADGSKTYTTSDGKKVTVATDGSATVTTQEVVDAETGKPVSPSGNNSTGGNSGSENNSSTGSSGNSGNSGSSSSSTTTETSCTHNWKAATCTDPKTCTKCGATEGSALGHSWKEATCTDPKTCTRCGKTEGSAKGHNYKWVTTKEAAVGVEGLKENKCTVCGHVDGTETIPALADVGQETPWAYTDSTHRTKTMYDGTVINEELVTCGNYSVWGYYDDGAASAMNDAVNYMLSQIDGWNPFNVSSAYYDNARRNAVAYAIKGSSTKAYHANFGGLPIIEEDKKYITLGSDGNNQDNYIGCFVYDTYQGNGDSTYGEYWRSHFGTYYASGSF